jgi:hypothetical protein
MRTTPMAGPLETLSTNLAKRRACACSDRRAAAKAADTHSR